MTDQVADDDELKRRICEALGVTWEEVDALDKAMYGPELRAERARGEAEVLKSVDAELARLNALLPPELQLTWANERRP